MTPEQIQASYKANLETLFGLTNKAFESVEKLVELNLAASKAAIADVTESAKASSTVKDAQELLALQASHFQPLAEKATAYSRHLYEIASNTGAEFAKVAESQVAQGQEKFQEMVSTAAKNAPAGSEPAVAMVQSAVAAANNALESVQKAVKQATEVAEANFKTMTDNVGKAAATATESVAKASAKKAK